MKPSTNICPACGTAIGVNPLDGKLGCPHMACCYVGETPRAPSPRNPETTLTRQRENITPNKTMKTYPNTFSAFNNAFHALEEATIGLDKSPALSWALHALGNAQDLFNESADGFEADMHPSDIADMIADLKYHTYKLEGWKASDVSDADYIGTMGPFGDDVHFEILNTGDKLVFSGACNAGFLESGFLPLDPDDSLSDSLEKLSEELEAFHLGKGHVSIVCNNRM